MIGLRSAYNILHHAIDITDERWGLSIAFSTIVLCIVVVCIAYIMDARRAAKRDAAWLARSNEAEVRNAPMVRSRAYYDTPSRYPQGVYPDASPQLFQTIPAEYFANVISMADATTARRNRDATAKTRETATAP